MCAGHRGEEERKKKGKKTNRTRGGVMACHAKALSSMNIPWEFTLNCFWFVYFFRYSALALTPASPTQDPHQPPPAPPPPPPPTHMPPSPHHPPYAFTSGAQMSIKRADGGALQVVNKSHSATWLPPATAGSNTSRCGCEGAHEFIIGYFRVGAPYREPTLPVANANGFQNSEEGIFFSGACCLLKRTL